MNHSIVPFIAKLPSGDGHFHSRTVKVIRPLEECRSYDITTPPPKASAKLKRENACCARALRISHFCAVLLDEEAEADAGFLITLPPLPTFAFTIFEDFFEGFVEFVDCLGFGTARWAVAFCFASGCNFQRASFIGGNTSASAADQISSSVV